MIKNIIFDFDGVLVDSEIIVAKAFSKHMRILGFNINEKKFYNFAGKKTIQVVTELADEFSIKDKKKFYSDIMNIASKIYSKKLKTVVGVFDYLKNSNFKHYIGSNSSKIRVIEGLKKVGLINYFPTNKIYSFDMVANPKPAPDIYLKIIIENCLEVKETIIVEDSNIGVIAGVASGVNVIGLTAGSHWNIGRDKNELYKAGAKIVIDSYSELNLKIAEL